MKISDVARVFGLTLPTVRGILKREKKQLKAEAVGSKALRQLAVRK